MTKRIAAALATSACFFLTPAAQAVTFTQITFVPSGGGTVTSTYGASGLDAGAFSNSFAFTLPSSGMLSASLITIALAAGSPDDVDFTSASINGEDFILSPTDFVETGRLTLPFIAGGSYTLTVNGTAIGGGSYSGNINFGPAAAVPEPAAWAMMILGMGGVGAAMRRRRGMPVRRLAVRYA